jgi:hypothetical protein
MEYIRGETMRNIDARSLSERTRSRLLKRILDAEIVIYHAGVNSGDFCPRNIMITGLQTSSKDDIPDSVTIKAIDFNVSTVRSHSKCYSAEYERETVEEYQVWLPKLPSPLLRWFQNMDEFAWLDWCPSGDGEPELWLWEQYHDDERYIPVVWDPSNPDNGPEYAEFESGSEKSVDSGLGLDAAVEKGEECGDMSGFGSADHGALAVQSS